jgi:hypothetical protein
MAKILEDCRMKYGNDESGATLRSFNMPMHNHRHQDVFLFNLDGENAKMKRAVSIVPPPELACRTSITLCRLNRLLSHAID